MVKKLFALASVTALAGLVATVGVGCSEDSTNNTPPETDAGAPDAKKDGKGPGIGDDEEPGEPPPSKTTGNECAADEDCLADGTVNENLCSKGFFTDGDLNPSPVCMGLCTPNANATSVAELLCDGETGVCVPSGNAGICFAVCQYDSEGIQVACKGSNKCSPAYNLTKGGTPPASGSGAILGICLGGCSADADCKGTAGQKCQVETGLCLNADKHIAYAKAVGEGCDNSATPDECSCASVREGVDKDKGYCTHACVTGAAGDAVCNTAKAGWKCTAGLPAKDKDGKVVFSNQPEGVQGSCAQPCTDDDACAALATASGVTGGTTKGNGKVVCAEFANGKFCDIIQVP
jgi:hypothetical protein